MNALTSITTNNIDQSAMLVHLSITRWSGRKADRSAAEELTSNAGAKAGTARVTKDLIPRSHLTDVDAAYKLALETLHKVSLPWDDLGQRLVPADLILRLNSQLQGAEDKFRTAVGKLVSSYDELRQGASADLGTMFDANDYPPAHVIAAKFKFAVHFTPVPSSDIRVALPEGLREAVSADIEAQVHDRLQATTSAVLERTASMITRMKAVLSAETPRIYESLVGDMQELVEIMPSLNLTGDATVAAIAAEMKDRFSSLDVNTLRDHPIQRDIAVSNLNEVMGMVAGLL